MRAGFKINHLILVMLFFLAGCSKKEKVSFEMTGGVVDSKPLVMIIYDRDDSESLGVMKEIVYALEYTKIPGITRDISILRNKLKIPESIRTIVITASETEKIGDNAVKEILSFTANGGTLILTNVTWDPRFHFFAGIKSDAGLNRNNSAKGWFFKINALPGIEHMEFRTDVMPAHYGFTSENFNNSAKILVSAVNDRDYPVLVENQIGYGRTIFYNTTILNDKMYRGLLFSTIIRGLPGIMYPVANISAIFLDDFTEPMYNAMMHPVDKEYGLNQTEFICNVWWPDMAAMADTFDLYYTAMPTFNYNDLTAPPFIFDEWYFGKIEIDGKVENASPWLSRKIVESRHEFAFHGYNHVSLWEKDWSNLDYAVLALIAVRKQWKKDDLGPLPVTYVPPTNNIDSSGIAALRKGMPSIKYMCSLYLGEIEEGGGREFAPDPYMPTFFDIPRISSGYYMTNEKVFNQENLYILSGIWTHFIHPDDIFFENTGDKSRYSPRNERELWWKNTPGKNTGLYWEFRDWIIRNKKVHPLIKYAAVSDAAKTIIEWRQQKVKRASGTGWSSIRILKPENDNNPIPYFVYANHENVRLIHQQIKEIANEKGATPLWDGKLFEFSAPMDSILLKIDPGKKLSDEEFRQIKAKYNLYLKTNKEGEPEWEFDFLRWFSLSKIKSVSRAIEEKIISSAIEHNRVDIAIAIYQDRILSHSEWDSADAVKLIEYLYWEKRPQDAWRITEQRYELFPDSNSVLFRKFVEQRVEKHKSYPDYFWFLKEFHLMPNKEQTLLSYLKDHESDTTWKAIKPLAIGLIHREQASSDFITEIATRYFWYEHPDSTVSFISSLPKDKIGALKPIAGEIARLYAYDMKDKATGLFWAEQDADFPVPEKLEWERELTLYWDWIETYRQYQKSYPDSTSLLKKMVSDFIDEGFTEEALETAYRHKEKILTDANLTKKISDQIAASPEGKRKEFVEKYPEFVSDSLYDVLKERIIRNEHPSITVGGKYSEDNFDNQLKGIQTEFGWGNRQKDSWKMRLEYDEVTTGEGTAVSHRILRTGMMGWSRFFQKNNARLEILGGMTQFEEGVLPIFSIGLSGGSYYSFSIKSEPVYTVPALRKKLLKTSVQAYIEQPIVKNRLDYSIGTTINAVSDGIWFGEVTPRIYLFKPTHSKFKVYPGLEVALQDATRVHQGGLPYWTPENLYSVGGGLVMNLERKKLIFNSDAFIKKDNESGFYGTFSYELDWKLRHRWRMISRGYFSTSKVYRYNEAYLGISYHF